MNKDPWQARETMARNAAARRPSPEVLRELYEGHCLSYDEIGRRYGVAGTSVMRWLRKAGVAPRSKAEATRLGMRTWKPTEEHKAKLRQNAAIARSRVTADSYAKQSEAMRGREPPNKGGTWSEETKAKHGYRQNDEYRRRQSERQKGEKSHLWKGGQTTDEQRRMQNWEWRQRRKECYARDGYLCQDCNVHCTNIPGPTRIQAHHVLPRRYGGGDELENLVTLCTSCHHKREWASRKEQP